MTVCLKCRAPSHLDFLLETGESVFMLCRLCHGLALYRRQPLRGLVVRAGEELAVVDAVGEIEVSP